MASEIKVKLEVLENKNISTQCKQNDDLVLEASIYEGSKELDLTNSYIIIQARKSDLNPIVQDENIIKSGNKIIAELDREFTKVPGLTIIEIVMIEKGKQNTTFSFSLLVEKSVINIVAESKILITPLERLQNTIIEAKENNEIVKTTINSAKENNEALTNTVNAAEAANVKVEENINNLDLENTAADTNISTLTLKNTKAEENIIAIESKNTEAVTNIAELETKIVAAGEVKAETEQLIATGGAATKGDIDKVNSSLELKAPLTDLAVERERINNIVAVKDSVDNLETADLRVGADGKTYSSAGEAVREQIKEVNNNKIEFITENIFDITKVKKDYYINNETGVIAPYKGWDTFEFSVPTEGSERYSLYCFDTSWIEPNRCFIGFFKDEGVFVGGYAYKKLSEAENRNGINKIVVSVERKYFENYCIISKTEELPQLSNLNDYINKNYLKDNYKKIQPIKKENIKFFNPYIFIGWNKNCYFKFDKIQFNYNNVNYEILWEEMTTKFPTLITATMTSRVRNTLQLKENKYLVLDLINLNIGIVDNLRENHVLLLDYKWELDVINGLLFESYQANITNTTGRIVQEFIPTSILDKIDEKTEVVSKSLDDGNFTFAYLTDNHTTGHHLGKETDLTSLAVNYVDKQIDFDAILNGGDNVLSYGNAINSLVDGINKTNRSKYVMCEGNHDRYILPAITRKQYYNTVLRHYRNNNDVSLVKNRSYYYRDFSKHKVRVICLTLYDMPDEKESLYPYNDFYGYNQEQMEWLCNTALKISSDWQVMVITHSSPVTNLEGMHGNGAGGQNPLVLRQILESFKNGTNVTVTHSSTVAEGQFNINITTNFQTQGAREIICVLSGHNHLDRQVKINGINYVSSICGYVDSIMYSGLYGDREGLTYSGLAFDVCLLFKDRRTLYFKRYGFGNDREITY